MPNVANDADDLIRLAADSRDQSFAQCFFVRKSRIDELLADDDHLVALSHFLLGEIPSAQQRNSHRAEVVLVHATKVNAKAWSGETGGRPSTVKGMSLG